MILIITHKDDYTADFLIDKLNNQSISYYRFNCEDCLKENITLRFNYLKGHTLLGERSFNSVWFRRTKLPEIEGLKAEERLYILNEVDCFLSNLFGIIKAKWLSNPLAVRSAENKFFQLTVAKEVGFTIPKTIVTSDRKEILCFFQANNKTIIKPIDKGRIDYADGTSKFIFTNIIDPVSIEQINSYKVFPSIFQEYIEKEYEVRVTVVDNQVFAAKVLSQSDEESSIDWRRKKLKFISCDFPPSLEVKCKTMLKHLGIHFGAFDFIKAIDGTYYFLEVNPNGQWVWIENDTGLKISDAIINYLSC